MKATKRIAVLGLALMLAVCFAGVAFAADKPATPAAPAAKAAAPAAKAAVPAVKTININKASEKDLTQLKGVDAKLAKAIVTYRTKKGAFKAPADLLKVKGVTKKILEQNKAAIVVK